MDDHMNQPQKLLGYILGFSMLPSAFAQTPTTQPDDLRRQEQRLSFQTDKGWSARENLNADVAMCYGIDSSLPDRLKSWRDHGYIVQLMTGVAWGNYQDY